MLPSVLPEEKGTFQQQIPGKVLTERRVTRFSVTLEML